jgi:hypothetical protein
MSASIKPLADVFREGQTANLDGLEMTCNPYPQRQPAHEAWLDGYKAPHAAPPAYAHVDGPPMTEMPPGQLQSFEGVICTGADPFSPHWFDQHQGAHQGPDGRGFHAGRRPAYGDMLIRNSSGQSLYLWPEDADALIEFVLAWV